MKRCTKCNAVYNGNEKFCKKCGSPLVDVQAGGNGPVKKKAVKKTSGPKKSKTPLIIALLLVLALIIGGGTAFVIHLNKQAEAEEEALRREREEEDDEDDKDTDDEDDEDGDDEDKEKDLDKKKDKEKEDEEEELSEEEKKKAEEQAELLKKFEEQEAAEAAEAEAKEKAKQEADAGTQSKPGTAVTGPKAEWQNTCDLTEEADAEIKADIIRADSNDKKMTLQEERFWLWDDLLNDMWKALKEDMDAASFKTLTNEQIDWIHEKEAYLQAYWDAEGVNMATCPYPNAPAGDMTRERIYYLLEKFSN